MPFAEFLRNRPAGLAIAAGLLLGACAPAAHVDGVSGGDSATMLRIGDSARDAGDITAAIPIYRRAHALAPLENAPLLRLANTLHAVGAYHEAGDAWSRVLRLDHRSFEARVGYGETLVALGQPTLALEQFRLAREIGQDATLFNGIGVANDMLGDAAAAQAAYREGLTIERSLRLLNNLGLSLALSGAHNEAVAILEEANAFPGAGLLNVAAQQVCRCPGNDDVVDCAISCPDGEFAPMFVEVAVSDEVDLWFTFPGVPESLSVAASSSIRVR